MNLGTYKFVDAEIWFGDRFWGDTKKLCSDFQNFDFSRFSGVQSSNFCYFVKIFDFDPLKNREKSKFQKSPHNVFVSPQNISLNQISASTDFLDPSHFMSKLAIFPQSAIFPIFDDTPFYVNDHKIKSNYI